MRSFLVNKFLSSIPLVMSIFFFSFHNSDEARRFSICGNCSGCPSWLSGEEGCANGDLPSTSERTSVGTVTNSTYHVTLIDVGKRQRVAYKFRLALEINDLVVSTFSALVWQILQFFGGVENKRSCRLASLYSNFILWLSYFSMHISKCY